MVVLLIVLLSNRGPSDQPGQSPSPTPTPTPTATAKPAAKKTPMPSGALPQSYNDAMATYSGRRLQFDAYCQANPSSLSVNRGDAIMLDNRSGDPRWIKVGANAYYLDGYGWKIVTPVVSSVPTLVYLDCGSSKNVGVLNVQ